MLAENKRLFAFLAVFFIAFALYDCKSVKPRANTRVERNNNSGGNPAPVANISTNDTFGLAPFKAALRSKGNDDHDGNEKLAYQWTVNNEIISTEPNPTFTFPNNGNYYVVLKVTNSIGKSSMDTVEIKVGHSLPKVTILVSDNSTFFFDRPTTFRYAVEVNENKEFDRDKLRVTMKYLPHVADDAVVTDDRTKEKYEVGRNLLATNDCKTCHQVMGKSSVPSFMQVSEKYWNNKNAIDRLANKIITGGSGVWGVQVMSAHPQLSREEATAVVKYILSMAVDKPDMEIPQAGTEVLNEHIGSDSEGRYVFKASYTDKPGAVTQLTNKDVMVLRPSKVEAEQADFVGDMQIEKGTLNHINNRSYFVLKNIDLKDVHRLRYRYSSKEMDAAIEVHIDAPGGQLVSTAAYKATGAWERYEEVSTTLTDPGGKHDLYFVFVKADAPNTYLAALDWIRFEGGREVKIVERAAPGKTKLSKAGLKKERAATTGRRMGKDKAYNKGKKLGNVLLAKNDCYTCHRIGEKLVGPAFIDVARRYQNRPFAISTLTNKVLLGGSGNWGRVPMLPHPHLSRKDAAEMVRYILSLRK